MYKVAQITKTKNKMTRKEEREEVARNRANQYSHPVEWNDCYKHWIEGAEWADANPDGKMLLHVLNKSAEQAKKQMIDKACEWWENEFTYPSMTSEEIEWYKQKVNDFRKAMKE
jgi:hypothetical protein